MWERLHCCCNRANRSCSHHFMDEADACVPACWCWTMAARLRKEAADLIARHLEPDVVEVYGNGALALVDSPLRNMAARVEVSGETVFFYTSDAASLLSALGAHTQLRTLHRPANLEDLFLKLTGRQIREDA